MSKTIIKIATIVTFLLCIGLGYLIGYWVADGQNIPASIQGGAIGPLVRDTVVIHDTIDEFKEKYSHYEGRQWYYIGKTLQEPDHCKKTYWDDTADVYTDSVCSLLRSAQKH